MYPAIVADEIKTSVLEYLRTSFNLSDKDVEKQLIEFLGDPEKGIFKGPYLNIQLGYRPTKTTSSLEINPPFTPFIHQAKAFERLYSGLGAHPQNTLITTGTGSGKTECFMYPLLDHCLRHADKPGIKAIILYPMNALASDQAGRFAETIANHPSLVGKLTAGIYVGGKGGQTQMGPRTLIDNRDQMRENPPDILLTNYKMLDFMLLRPEDKSLWAGAETTLQYLIIDELHTFDGAQASDVACLIRRLKGRLKKKPGDVICVGTSATIGGEESGDVLERFASKIFGERFRESVIREFRIKAEDAFSEPDMGTLNPREMIQKWGEAEVRNILDINQHTDADEYLEAQKRLWFREVSDEPEAEDKNPRNLLAEKLTNHPLTKTVVQIASKGVLHWQVMSEAIKRTWTPWGDIPPDMHWPFLQSFLSLIAAAKNGNRPFLSCQIQLWVREVRGLVKKVSHPDDDKKLKAKVFAWDDEIGADKNNRWLPMVYCNTCGGHGLASVQYNTSDKYEHRLKDIRGSWFRQVPFCRYLKMGTPPAGNLDLFGSYLHPLDLISVDSQTNDRGDAINIPFYEVSGEGKSFKPNCPDCDTGNSLIFAGSRAASLASVALTEIYSSNYNTSPKMIAFSDSIQDASHRAGFFGARTYRFNLRRAIQQVIEAQKEKQINLEDLSHLIFDYWRDEMGKDDEFLATFVPSDLTEVKDYQRFLEKEGDGDYNRFFAGFKQRLGWEVLKEFGLLGKRGRTLEQSDSSSVDVVGDFTSFSVFINEEQPFQIPITCEPERAHFFVAAVLRRLRLRGGLHHSFLDQYAKSGKWYDLTKDRKRYNSPFGSKSVLPAFLTTNKASEVFDTIAGPAKKATWYRNFAARVFKVDGKDPGITDLYMQLIQHLLKAEVLTETMSGTGYVYGAKASAFIVDAKTKPLRCETCSNRVIVPSQNLGAWENYPCTRYRCRGTLKASPKSKAAYYQNLYKTGRVSRIISRAHTGTLEREEREKLEREFRDGAPAGAPNLVVATPTLEMGIDIGDLSGVMCCNVPPRPANYLQRIGRAGRKTGNALCLTVSLARPHDQYFHADPLKMVAGEVVPPGCFLDAPGLLKRQLVAMSIDTWAAQEDQVKRIPANISKGGWNGKMDAPFPGRLFDSISKNRLAIFENFKTLFPKFSDHNLSELQTWFVDESGADVAIRKALDDHINLRDHEKSRKAKLRKAEDKLKLVPKPTFDQQKELKILASSLFASSQTIRQLEMKYLLNVLTDASALPNYAFPEPGVTLDIRVKEKNEGSKISYEKSSMQRSASAAIREFAPFNTFYAGGFKMKIGELDMGTPQSPALQEWRCCPSCAFMKIEDRTEPDEKCPSCADPNFAEVGQLKKLVLFRRARTLVDGQRDLSVDNSDDRERVNYHTLECIDFIEGSQGAMVCESKSFGYEYFTSATLREINFGEVPKDNFASHVTINGNAVRAKGFDVCTKCGAVTPPNYFKEKGKYHTHICKAKNQAVNEPISLYREMSSEAIRLLVPAARVLVERSVASFKAAVQLGLRKRFGGDPSHLMVTTTSDPILDDKDRRKHFVVIYDTVPGGTGYLSTLWKEGEAGHQILDVLRDALNALLACGCSREQDGCYECVYGYHSAYDFDVISKLRAIDIMEDILSIPDDGYVEIPSLGLVNLDHLEESELEVRFRESLQTYARTTAETSIQQRTLKGKHVEILEIGEYRWVIQAQEDLRKEFHTITDFTFICESHPSIGNVALYLDGYKYHVMPEEETSRLAGDVEKRNSLIAYGGYKVWTLTWHDLEKKDAISPSLFKWSEAATVRRENIHKDKEDFVTMQQSPFYQLMDYLRGPERDWEIMVKRDLKVAAGARKFPVADDRHEALQRSLLQSVDFSIEIESGKSTMPSGYWREPGIGLFLRAQQLTGSVALHPTLRLFDDERQESDFKKNWRAFFAHWNLLQFIEGTRVTATGAITSIAEASQSNIVQSFRPDPPHDLLWDELLEEEQDDWRWCYERRLPLPEPGEDIFSHGKVGGRFKWMWSKQKIGMFTKGEEFNAPTGWKIIEKIEDIEGELNE